MLYLEANDKMTKQMHRLNHFIQAMRVFPDYKLWMLITKKCPNIAFEQYLTCLIISCVVGTFSC